MLSNASEAMVNVLNLNAPAENHGGWIWLGVCCDTHLYSWMGRLHSESTSHPRIQDNYTGKSFNLSSCDSLLK